MRVRLVRKLSHIGIGPQLLRLISVTTLLVMSGCATSSFNSGPTERWLPDGSLGLARPIPRFNLVAEAMAQPKNDMFMEPKARMRSPEEMPIDTMVPRLVVETTKHTLTFSQPGEASITMKAQGAYALKKGSYSVALKQTDPLWYAPPTYFLRRGIKVPPDGSKARFMRGALGHQALFFDKQVAIHSGPIWNDEIGGIKLSQEDMARLFETVGIGTKIEVR